jgi:outer membrane protein OmpA-like peptidoglycan-associated protein
VVLTGYVPDEKARGVLLATAQQRFAGRRVRDELQLGAGQPPGWEQCVEAGLEALQRLGNGRAAITGRRLLVSGNTDAEPLAQSLPADVRGRAGSSCDTDVRVTLDLTAIQAKEETRRRTEQEDAQRKSDLDRTRQETQARADAERRQAEEAQRAKAEADRRQADQGASQRAEEERRRAEQAARLKAEEDRRRTEADKARTPAEQKARQQVVDACQAAMSKVAHEGVINFKRASYDLDPTSFATLNLLAEAANRCSTVVVEIEGHTDAEGTVERNQLLSDRRANSVRDYLVRAGVDPRRLVAIGYGQQKNIAPNTTAEGRAKNRRIEFVVKMP